MEKWVRPSIGKQIRIASAALRVKFVNPGTVVSACRTDVSSSGCREKI
jgi:hypothetical protein